MIFKVHHGIHLWSRKLFNYPDDREVAVMVKTPSLLETLCKDMSCHKANSSTCNDEELQRFESFGELTHVKRQAGYRQDPGNPTQDPKWEWQDPTIGGGIPHFPPGMKT